MIKIDILPNYFLKEDKTFNKEEAINLCGKIAGVCYDKEGFSHLENEPIEKTKRRIDLTLNNGHHSVYDHININFNLQNIPKILAMIINNEKQYTTSEKSARYTPVIRKENSIITEKEESLYNKWMKIIEEKTREKYGYILSDYKITKLAQENARYMVTIFMPTQMIYTTTLRQINYIASWMYEYIKEEKKTNFEKKLQKYMQEFVDELKRLDVLEEGLLKNEKCRKFSLFGKDLDKKEEYFGDIYATTYKTTFACLAHTQRHRTLNYQIEILEEKEYFIPPILETEELKEEWLNDIKSVSDINPQGELIRVHETGSYDDFILKCKERLCSAAQLETETNTKNILNKYKENLEKKNHPLKEDIKKYSRGARCTFPTFKCSQDCNFKEGKLLDRKI